MGGFEPPTSWSQTTRSYLAELHPEYELRSTRDAYGLVQTAWFVPILAQTIAGEDTEGAMAAAYCSLNQPGGGSTGCVGRLGGVTGATWLSAAAVAVTGGQLGVDRFEESIHQLGIPLAAGAAP